MYEKHGHASCSKKRHPLYGRWLGMIRRCCSGTNPHYVGISVCGEWRSFPRFLEDMEADFYRAEKEFGKVHLDRKNNNLGYSKENCRWASLNISVFNKTPSRNTNKYPPGVSREKNRFRACIGFQGKKIHIGMFSTQEEASEAYRSKCLEIYGEIPSF